MAGPQEEKPPAAPVEVVDTDFSRIYTHIHPILVLSLYTFSFPAIVADPIQGLTYALPWLLVLQIAYAAICLPPMEGGTASAEKKRPGEKKKKAPASASSISPKALLSCFALVNTCWTAIPAITLTLVLLGAPITNLFGRTLLCATHMAILTTFPMIYVHGLRLQACREVVALMRPMDEVYGALIGTLVGAWFGAIPTALDWDREWQKWPVTIVTGAYIGYSVGKMLGGTLLKGKIVSFDL